MTAMVSLKEEDGKALVELEPELHEGDGKIPVWLWVVVASIIVSAAVFAPFQLF